METGLCESHYTPSSLHSFFFPFTSQLHNCIFLFYVDASLCAKRQRQWLVSFYSDWMPSVPLEILQSWPTACIILPYIISKNTHKQYILISKTLLDFEFRYWKMCLCLLTLTQPVCTYCTWTWVQMGLVFFLTQINVFNLYALFWMLLSM